MRITIAHWVELKRHVTCIPWTWLYNYWLAVIPVNNWDPVVSRTFQRWHRLFPLWGDGVYSHFTLKFPPLLRSSSCPWSKPTLLCSASSSERVCMPGRLWCVGIAKPHQRAVAHESDTCLGERQRFVTGKGRSPPTGVTHRQHSTHQV